MTYYSGDGLFLGERVGFGLFHVATFGFGLGAGGTRKVVEVRVITGARQSCYAALIRTPTTVGEVGRQYYVWPFGTCGGGMEPFEILERRQGAPTDEAAKR